MSRITHTNLDVKQEKRIDDFWNIDGSRDLSESWTGCTQFISLEEKPPNGYMWSGWRLPRQAVNIQSRSFMGSVTGHFGSSHFSQGGVASARSPVCFGVVRFFLHPRQTSMGCRGWQAMEVPQGWFNVIRGPRPPSVRWPQAQSSNQPVMVVRNVSTATHSTSGDRSVQGRWRQGRPDCWSARKRIAGLEAAISAMLSNGLDEKSAEVRSLQDSLAKAKRKRTRGSPRGPGEGCSGVHRASPETFGRRRLQKNTDFFVLLCLPASFLTFGKVNDRPPQTDIFLGGGVLPHPPPLIFVSAGPPQTDILLGGGGSPPTPPPSFLSAPGPPLRLTFFGRGGEGFKSQPYTYQDENEVDHNQDAIVSSKRSCQVELQVTVPIEHSQPTCPVVDMTQQDSVSEARSDTSLSGVLKCIGGRS